MAHHPGALTRGATAMPQEFNQKLEYFTDPLSYTLPDFNPPKLGYLKTQATSQDDPCYGQFSFQDVDLPAILGFPRFFWTFGF